MVNKKRRYANQNASWSSLVKYHPNKKLILLLSAVIPSWPIELGGIVSAFFGLPPTMKLYRGPCGFFPKSRNRDLLSLQFSQVTNHGFVMSKVEPRDITHILLIGTDFLYQCISPISISCSNIQYLSLSLASPEGKTEHIPTDKTGKCTQIEWVYMPDPYVPNTQTVKIRVYVDGKRQKSVLCVPPQIFQTYKLCVHISPRSLCSCTISSTTLD